MITVDVSKCTGCKQCESVCAFFHTGRVNNRLSRIKVMNLYETGIDGPVVCNQCTERYCMKCPENALTIGKFGEVIVSPTMCNLCGACEKNCPLGALEIFNDIVYVCDLCGGKPNCVKACTEKAITWDKGVSEQVSLEDFKKQTKKMNPSQKRNYCINKLGFEVRKKWRQANA